jgi:hypothetical protein
MASKGRATMGVTLAVITAVAAVSSARPRPPKEPSGALTREAAIQVLETTDTFAGVSIGFGGERSKESCAFAVVSRERDAAEIFRSLLGKASLAGQLYALCGLYSTDPDGFKEAVEPYRRSTDEVKTMFGCIGGRQKVSALVENTSPRTIRLNSPKETLDAWVKRDPNHGQSFFMDIYGGGYPAEFRAQDRCR